MEEYGHATPAARAITFSGNFNTVPVNGTIDAVALMLDPRGYAISGAAVAFASTPSADDHGAFQFVGTSGTTGPDGNASVTVRLTAAGRVQMTPSFVDAHLAS